MRFSASLQLACRKRYADKGNKLFFANGRVTVYILPGAGYCISLHENAIEWYEAANRWIQSKFRKT
jgi:hypothetical protein